MLSIACARQSNDGAGLSNGRVLRMERYIERDIEGGIGIDRNGEKDTTEEIRDRTRERGRGGDIWAASFHIALYAAMEGYALALGCIEGECIVIFPDTKHRRRRLHLRRRLRMLRNTTTPLPMQAAVGIVLYCIGLLDSVY